MLLAALRRRPSSTLPSFPSPAFCRGSCNPNFLAGDRALLVRFWNSIALQHRQQTQYALLVRFYSSDGKRGDEASADTEPVADSETANETPSCPEGAKTDVKVKGKKTKSQDEQSSTAKATLPGLWKRFLMKPKEAKEPKEVKEVKETKETNADEVQEAKEVKEIAEVRDAKENDAAVPAPAEDKRAGAIVPMFVRYEKVREVLVVPLTEKPAFPGLYRAPAITDPKLLDKILEDKAADKRFVGAFLLKDSSQLRSGVPTSWINDAESKDEDKLRGLALYKQLYEYGTLCKVKNVTRMFNPPQVVLQGHVRLRLTGVVSEDPLVVSVEWVKDKPFDAENDVLKATQLEAISTMQSLMMLSPFFREGISQFLQSGGSLYPPQVGDCGIGLSTAEGAIQQRGLEELDVLKRVNMALTLLKKDLDIYKLQMSIAKSIEEKVSGEQRRFFLMEQLKAIKKELGLEADDKTALSAKFRERVDQHKSGIPPHVLQVIEEELAKLQVLEASSSEFNVTRNYLDWLTSMPWGQYSKENFDVSRARKILDEDHYGLSDIKERIMEFIAVGKLRGTVQGKIICLSGPPGVGKTSIGRSIAKALNRKFFRFSVGGLSDVAEIKGHRRTYVGAMPGKMVQCLKSTGTANPLVLIDEIDKLGRGHAGDPASALLELLDPEQNANFLDHYLDVPIDLSKVLFVCTANVIETIPGPLLDRMEIIRLVGYISDEKMHIARDYLEPAARSGCGIKPEQAAVTEGALHVLIETYCREAGVRNLQKQIEKIYRKIALKLVSKDAEIQEKMKVVDIPTGSEETQKKQTEDNDANKQSEKPIEEGEVVHPVSAESAEVVSEVILEEPESGNEVEIRNNDKAVFSEQTQKKILNEEIEVTEDASQPNEQTLSEVQNKDETVIENKDEAVVSEQTEEKISKEEIEVTKDASGPKEQALLEDQNIDGTADGVVGSVEQETGKEEEATREEKPLVVIEKIIVDESNLSEYVGNAVFQSDRIYDQTPIGVVMGLAWTAMGGSTLYVETTLIDQGEGKGSLHLTGQLGDVMKESASIAHTVARAILRERDPENTFFKNTSLHLHVPAGATPKDGPSAGCTMITSMLSVAMNKPVKKDVAMTGEVTLTGRILPIGGVKEKTIAARRSAVKTLIFPKANKPDFDELLPHIKEGFDVKFVEHYMEIFRIAFNEEEVSEANDNGAPETKE